MMPKLNKMNRQRIMLQHHSNNDIEEQQELLQWKDTISPPCGASLLLGVEHFLGLTALL